MHPSPSPLAVRHTHTHAHTLTHTHSHTHMHTFFMEREHAMITYGFLNGESSGAQFLAVRKAEIHILYMCVIEPMKHESKRTRSKSLLYIMKLVTTFHSRLFYHFQLNVQIKFQSKYVLNVSTLGEGSADVLYARLHGKSLKQK